jgi:hypothetical protein
MFGTRRQQPRRHCMEVMCVEDRRTHFVDDVMVAAAARTESGRLLAECGRSVLAAALAEPLGPLCPLCVAVREGVASRHGGTRERGAAVPRPREATR